MKGQSILVYISKTQASEAETHARTLFLTNLPLTTSETSLRDLVKEKVPLAEIEEVRLIRDSKGKVKGFAYI